METKNTTNEVGLVFTMHKVGSSTFMQAMREIGIAPERGYAENRDYLMPLEKYHGVVTAVRDPVARNISFFFERYGSDILAINSNFGYKGLFKRFMESVEHNYPVTWFEEVFEPTFGLDVYKQKFVKSKGWAVYQERYLVMRTDKIEKSLQYAFQSLYGQKPPKLHRARTEETRAYGQIYADFLKEVRLPKDYVKLLYNTRYMKHFFLKEEIEELSQRWVKGL